MCKYQCCNGGVVLALCALLGGCDAANMVTMPAPRCADLETPHGDDARGEPYDPTAPEIPATPGPPPEATQPAEPPCVND